MFLSTRFIGLRGYSKAVTVLGLGLALMAATARPTYAGDGGAVAAGIIGGTALGLLAFGAGAQAYGPPPPPPYGVGPVDVGPPALCHDVMVESFDPYTEAYVEVPRRVCDGD